MAMQPYALFDTNDSEAAACIREICAAFGPQRKKIFIVGAGISQSAGVSTFNDPQGMLRKLGGRRVLSDHVFRTPHDTAKYLHVIKHMYTQAVGAAPTPFHWMIDGLVERGDLVRVYSQNIDGLELQCPRLSEQNVVTMHGLIRKMACPVCAYTVDMDITLFASGTCPPCPVCPLRPDTVHPGRTRQLLPRSARIRHGTLRPFVLLYDSEPEGWAGLDFSDTREFDRIEEPAHTVMVAGTNLDVEDARALAAQLCSSTHDNHANGTTIWLNIKDIPSKIRSLNMFDYAIKGTCDQFAQFIQVRK